MAASIRSASRLSTIVISRSTITSTRLPRSALLQRRSLSGAKAAKPGASSKLLWLGGAAAVLGGGYWYLQRSSAKRKIDEAVESAKSGNIKDAANKAGQALEVAYPELAKTFYSLLGKEVGDTVSKAYDALNKAKEAAAKLANTDAGTKLQARAKEIEAGFRDVLHDALNLRKQAVKELGPSANKHYENVKESVKSSEGWSWDTIENGLKTLRREGAEFWREAKNSHVGDELKKRVNDLVKKADELRNQAEAYLKERK